MDMDYILYHVNVEKFDAFHKAAKNGGAIITACADDKLNGFVECRAYAKLDDIENMHKSIVESNTVTKAFHILQVTRH